MCVCVCAHMRGADIAAHASSLVGKTDKDNQVFGGAWRRRGVRVAFGQGAQPWRSRVFPAGEEVKGKRVAVANGKVLLRPDLLRDEPLVIST